MSDSAAVGRLRGAWISLVHWIDTDYRSAELVPLADKPDRVEWVRTIPFVILHMGCLGVFWAGWSWTAVWSAVFLYFVRMFAITGFYHRYFSHRTFSTSRPMQFVLALWGAACVQQIGRAHV